MNFIEILKYLIDLIAVLLLALGIKGLSKVRSARAANSLAAIAMSLAVVGVLISSLGDSGISIKAWIWIFIGTYSSIFIASVFLVYWDSRGAAHR